MIDNDHNKKYQSITYYQTKIIIVITLVLGLLSSLYLALSDFQRLNQEFDNTVTQITNSIENSAASAVYTYNDILAEEVINGLFKFEPIVSVQIFDDTGVVLAEAEKPEPETSQHDFLSVLFNLDNHTINKTLFHKEVNDKSIKIGRLIIVVSPRHTIALFVERLTNHLLSTLAFTSILTFILILLFQRLLAAPLIKMAKVFSSFDPKHPDPVQLPDPQAFPNNEFRTVVENGRKMLETIHENLTELKRSHTELEDRVAERTASLQKLTQAIEQSPTMMFIVNRKSEIEYANTRFFEFTGYHKDEIIGQNPSILASGNTPTMVYKDLWKTVSAGDVWKHQIEDKKKDGTLYWASITIAPIHDHNDNITHYLCAQEDITERVVTHQNLLKARDEAEKANRSKSEFLSNMSHELRTPLNAILGFAQLLENGKSSHLSDKQKKHVHQILKGGNHLLELINEVLELSRIEAGKLGLSIEPVNAQELIEDCLSFAATIAQNNSIILKDCTKGTKPVLMVDRLRTKQIIMNLLSNAIKYNREGGSVWLYGEYLDDDYFRISIVDTGYGIPKDRQDELFQPFSRLGAETSAIEGTGIGLALSKKLIDAMQGRIGFNSVEEMSSTFWCDFKLSKESPAESKAVAADQDLLSLEGEPLSQEKLILYVEDNPANLALLEDVIDDIDGIKMISTHTAELGLEMALQEQPDMILLDINLPGMSGIEAVKKLKANEKTKAIPTIALSANAMSDTIKEGLLAGFDDYLTKPLKIHKLYQILESLLPTK